MKEWFQKERIRNLGLKDKGLRAFSEDEMILERIRNFFWIGYKRIIVFYK